MIVDIVMVALILVCLWAFDFIQFSMQKGWMFLGALAAIALVIWLARGTGGFIRPWNRGTP